MKTEYEKWIDEIQYIVSANKYLTDKQCDRIYELSEYARIAFQDSEHRIRNMI